MHRHGYVGRKFGRETDQRKALIKGLVTSLFTKGSIETTLPKAKEIRPIAEALISKAVVGDLHNRRQIIAAVSTLTAAHKLVDEIAPKIAGRKGGYLRIKQTRIRVGDSAQMARVSFVDDITATKAVAKPEAKAKPAAKPVAKAEVKKAPLKKPVAKKAESK
jgi:large subunit ribosomal protein L17